MKRSITSQCRTPKQPKTTWRTTSVEICLALKTNKTWWNKTSYCKQLNKEEQSNQVTIAQLLHVHIYNKRILLVQINLTDNMEKLKLLSMGIITINRVAKKPNRRLSIRARPLKKFRKAVAQKFLRSLNKIIYRIDWYQIVWRQHRAPLRELMH